MLIENKQTAGVIALQITSLFYNHVSCHFSFFVMQKNCEIGFEILSDEFIKIKSTLNLAKKPPV